MGVSTASAAEIDSGFDVSPFAINPDIGTGTIKVVSPGDNAITVKGGSSTYRSNYYLPVGTYSLQFPVSSSTGATFFNVVTAENGNTGGWTVTFAANTYFFVEKALYFEPGTKVSFGGVAIFDFLVDTICARSSTTWYLTLNKINLPLEAAFCINGIVVSDFVSTDSAGSYVLPTGTYIASSDGIVSAGVVFRLQSSYSQTLTSSTSSRASMTPYISWSYKVNFKDDIFLDVVTPAPSDYSADLAGILQAIQDMSAALKSVIQSAVGAVGTAVQAVGSTVTNIKNYITSAPTQDADSEQYKGDMQETLDKIDDANQIIEDNTDRPSADSILPPVPDIIQDGVIGGGDAAATAMMGDFGTLLSSPLILQSLMLVFTLAFLSYVLFGKKE